MTFENMGARKEEALRTTNALWETGEAKEQFHLKMLKKSGPGLVAKAISFHISHKQPIGFAKNSSLLVYYPQPRHAEAFTAASKSLKSLGPSDWLPGAMAALHAKRQKRFEGESIRIEMLQGCFLESASQELSSKVAKKYSGWKQNLLHAIFDQAEMEGITKLIFANDSKQSVHSEKEFTQVAEKRGYFVTSDGHIHTATLKPKQLERLAELAS